MTEKEFINKMEAMGHIVKANMSMLSVYKDSSYASTESSMGWVYQTCPNVMRTFISATPKVVRMMAELAATDPKNRI